MVRSSGMTVLFAALALFLSLGLAETSGTGQAYPEARFSHAVNLYESGDFEGALEALEGTVSELPVIADYGLYYIAMSHKGAGRPALAMRYLGRLMAEHAQSPLYKEAARQMVLIQASLDRGRPGPALALMNEYEDVLGKDPVIMALRAELLLGVGLASEAEALYVELYVMGRPWTPMDTGPIATPALSIAQMHRRGENLMTQGGYAEAEGVFMQALGALEQVRSPEFAEARPSHDQLLGDLAMALFRQKRYSQAGPLFETLGRDALAAKSYLRAGRTLEFQAALSRLVENRDAEAPLYMMAMAEEYRRAGEFDKCVYTLQDAMERFPESREDASWLLGWANYRAGRLEEAGAILASMARDYGRSKYRYWLGRTLERQGLDASFVMNSIASDDYYGLLASRRVRDSSLASKTESPTPLALPHGTDFKRADTLMRSGLREAAARELLAMRRDVSDYSSALDIAYKFNEFGMYREAMLAIGTLPQEMRPDEILYPLAYWDEITREASRNSLDPVLVLSLIREESRFDRRAFSPAGAIGLMQLMPSTASRIAQIIGIQLRGQEDIFEVDKNLSLGTHYLSTLVRDFDSTWVALAAYNAGEHRVRQWLDRGTYDSWDEFVEDIPYPETRNYVKRIGATYYKYSAMRGVAGGMTL